MIPKVEKEWVCGYDYFVVRIPKYTLNLKITKIFRLTDFGDFSCVFYLSLFLVILFLLPLFCQSLKFVGIFAVNPQETQLLLLGTPRGLKPCCIWSMQSCEPTKVCLIFVFFRFLDFSLFQFALGPSNIQVWGCDLSIFVPYFAHLYYLFSVIYDTAHDVLCDILQELHQKQMQG